MSSAAKGVQVIYDGGCSTPYPVKVCSILQDRDCRTRIRVLTLGSCLMKESARFREMSETLALLESSSHWITRGPRLTRRNALQSEALGMWSECTSRSGEALEALER